MYLSKYLSLSGLCSRRKAAEIIKNGEVYVNNKIETKPSYIIKKGDVIIFNGEIIILQKKVYILLNKPKDYITTKNDERGRKTVLDLVQLKSGISIYPVGRLDRDTTGLLLLTNDGELAYKLSHPKFEIEKKYRILIDKNLTKQDFDKLILGIRLYDGLAKFDTLAFPNSKKSKKDIIVTLHSGKNRIIRRMFMHLGYSIKKLDRVSYAGLTKKSLPFGKWRFLNKQDVSRLLKI